MRHVHAPLHASASGVLQSMRAVTAVEAASSADATSSVLRTGAQRSLVGDVMRTNGASTTVRCEVASRASPGVTVTTR